MGPLTGMRLAVVDREPHRLRGDGVFGADASVATLHVIQRGTPHSWELRIGEIAEGSKVVRSKSEKDARRKCTSKNLGAKSDGTSLNLE
jgi:hypothetical protein